MYLYIIQFLEFQMNAFYKKCILNNDINCCMNLFKPITLYTLKNETLV